MAQSIPRLSPTNACLQVCGRDQLSSKCHNRGESQGMSNICLYQLQIRLPTLALKPPKKDLSLRTFFLTEYFLQKQLTQGCLYIGLSLYGGVLHVTFTHDTLGHGNYPDLTPPHSPGYQAWDIPPLPWIPDIAPTLTTMVLTSSGGY